MLLLSAANLHLAKSILQRIRKHGIHPTRFILTVTVAAQRMSLWQRLKIQPQAVPFPEYALRNRYRVSTSAYGLGQIADSNQTPLGLHRIAEKIGGGQP